MLSSEHTIIRTSNQRLPYRLSRPIISEKIIGQSAGLTKDMFSKFELMFSPIGNSQVPLARIDSTFSRNIRYLKKRITGEKIGDAQYKYRLSLLHDSKEIHSLDFTSATPWDLSKLKSYGEADSSKWACTDPKKLSRLESLYPWTAEIEGDLSTITEGKSNSLYYVMPGSVPAKSIQDLAMLHAFYDVGNFHQMVKGAPKLKKKGELVQTLLDVVRKVSRFIVQAAPPAKEREVHVKRLEIAIELLLCIYPGNETLLNIKKDLSHNIQVYNLQSASWQETSGAMDRVRKWVDGAYRDWEERNWAEKMWDGISCWFNDPEIAFYLTKRMVTKFSFSTILVEERTC